MFSVCYSEYILKGSQNTIYIIRNEIKILCCNIFHFGYKYNIIEISEKSGYNISNDPNKGFLHPAPDRAFYIRRLVFKFSIFRSWCSGIVAGYPRHENKPNRKKRHQN